MKKLILCLIALAAMFSIAQAAPFQTLGMLRTPDAYVLPHLAFEGMFVGYYRDVKAPSPLPGNEKAYKGWFPYAMIGGGILDRAELGVFLGDYTKEDDLTYYFNAKVKIIEETLRMPQISVGMDNILSPMGGRSQDLEPTEAYADHPDRESYEAFSPYAVASKQVIFAGIPWMLNGGFGMNRFIGQVTRSRIFNGLFASLEINPIQDLAILGEYDGEDFNAGVKYSVGNWGAKVGFSAVEDWAKDTDYKDNLRVGIGISYLFDKYAEAKRRRPDLKYVAMEPAFDETQTQVVYDEEGNAVEQPPFVAGAEEPIEGAIIASGSTLKTPGVVQGNPVGYDQLSPDVQDLMKELQTLQAERQKAQAAMDDLRKWIQDLKKSKE